ncbi:GAF domain-containing protein [Apilactobacillus apisilvae]|uniref:GAF domain-containing protein n=1 Tax=Apilactobacillus apisilvae TaxID=2923364 RepID=A0ABY4PIB5_9LACO|nr:GAF domain-containing protein [Apilactobacillus apisilvae]UQS85167.1 GAF domain-containing protein [Apilactobacillus apisilvae]
MSKIDGLIVEQINSLLTGENNNTANLANASALLMQSISNISWAGFYLYDVKNNELILGPFQGKVACMHIKNGSGVCGTAFKEQKILRVEDVDKFPGHIACDSNSKSEIVIPITVNNEQLGVLDIDAPIKNRFSSEDEKTLKDFTKALSNHLKIDK